MANFGKDTEILPTKTPEPVSNPQTLNPDRSPQNPKTFLREPHDRVEV